MKAAAKMLMILSLAFWSPPLWGVPQKSPGLELLKWEVEILRHLEGLERDLRKADQLLDAVVRKEEMSILRLRNTEAEAARITAKMKKVRALLKLRLAAYRRIRRQGILAFLLNARDWNHFLKRRRLLRRILEQGRQLFKKLSRNVARNRALKEELARRRAFFNKLREEIRGRRRKARQARLKYQNILATINRDQRLRRKALRERSQASRKLKTLIMELTRRLEGGRGFKARRKNFSMPVQGAVELSYGWRKDIGVGARLFHNGIDIRAPKGSPVHAIYGGRVVFAGWFRGFGKMIILAHGNQYHSLYAHLDRLKVRVRKRVDPGQTIGFLGDTASLKGAYLYFEIRYRGMPLNPMKWLKDK